MEEVNNNPVPPECASLKDNDCTGSGIIVSCTRQLGQLSPGDHACILYDDSTQKIPSISAFACSAIKLGHACLYLTSGSSRQEVVDAISKAYPSAPVNLVDKRLTTFDPGLFFAPHGIFEPDRAIALLKEEIKKASSNDCLLCVIGDMGWALRDSEPVDKLFEYESLLGTELPSCRSWKVICQYDVSKFHPKVIKEVLRTHPMIIWKGKVLRNFYYLPPEDFLSQSHNQVEVSRWISHLEEKRLKQLELEESEACYRVIFENAGTAICIIKSDYTVDLVNHHWVKTLGFYKEEVESRANLMDFVHPDDKDAVGEYLKSLDEACKNNEHGYEVRLVNAKGQTVVVAFTIHMIPGSGKYIVSALDITELKRKTSQLELYHKHLEELVRKRTRKLEAETEKSQKMAREIAQLYRQESELRMQLERSSSEKSKFMRFLVHELKTPLTPMMGSADILFEKVKGTELERLAANIIRGSHSLNNRVNDLLDLARGEMGLLHLSGGWVDLPGLLKDVVCYMAVEFERRRQLVCLDIDYATPMIWGDNERLRQVVINLMDNASKFTPAKGRIFVKTMVVNDFLMVVIRDTGVGIKKERQEAIFYDYSTHPKPDDPAANMGIGLHLCKLLIDLHGGDLWVNSTEGKGSEFGFSLPLDRDNNGR